MSQFPQAFTSRRETRRPTRDKTHAFGTLDAHRREHSHTDASRRTQTRDRRETDTHRRTQTHTDTDARQTHTDAQTEPDASIRKQTHTDAQTEPDARQTRDRRETDAHRREHSEPLT